MINQKFLVFEGIDGSGHSTTLELVANFLREKGHNVICTKEPTLDSEEGREGIRILKSKEAFDPKKLQSLFITDRREHVLQIEEWIKEGLWVLLDRYFFSTIAYGSAEGVDREWLIKENRGFIRPKYAFVFDLSSEEAIERIGKRGSPTERFEKEITLRKVRQNFLDLVGDFSEIIVINANRSKEEVLQAVLQVLNESL